MSQPVSKLTSEESDLLSVESVNDESVAASLGLNGQLFIFQLINFAIVALIVWWLILRPLVKKMEERRKLVDESLDKAKEIEAAFAKSQESYQMTVDKAASEANKIVAKARVEAAEQAEKMKIETKTEIQALIATAKKNISRERETMQAEFKTEIVEVVVSAVEKMLEKKLDDKSDRALIEQTLKEIK